MNKPLISAAAAASCARLLLVLATAFTFAPAHAAVIYSQPADGVNGYLSTVASNVAFFDDFTFADDATITDVHWDGGFDFCCEDTQIASFAVTFLTDDSGQPGSAVASETFIGNAGQTNPHPCTFTCFEYSVDLTNAFLANAGQRYWLSIVANTGSSDTSPDWFWSTGDGPNQSAWGGLEGERSAEGTLDLAFDLTGSTGDTGTGAVPEPVTLALLGVGLAGIGFSRRRGIAKRFS